MRRLLSKNRHGAILKTTRSSFLPKYPTGVRGCETPGRDACTPCAISNLALRGRMTQHDRLLIIDFGSQVTQLIARRLRELNVYCEIHPYNRVDDAFLAAFQPKAIIFSGGPASVFAEGAPMPPASAFTAGVPILGICYGQQVMMHVPRRQG
jgi:carbamoylphosphate synthase small subunit